MQNFFSDMPKSYDPKVADEKWYSFWEENNCFLADPHSEKPPFSIVIPPPNVTGVLHMGHALVNTLQDVLIRWKRMSGYEALWIPGTDHAGIATQTVVERNLKAMGENVAEMSRDEFVQHIWDWKEKNEHQIINQLKKLGSSCDWSRSRFTMDKGCSLSVRKIFKSLYDVGLIYRGSYLVNWDPVAQTALSDDEVEFEEMESSLWFINYPIKDSSEYITVATTRPETMLGDTAIAVSPSDERYLHLHGKTVIVPFVNREIKIITDDVIDPNFGTGAVKITPAHDVNDYNTGKRHNLELINILSKDGTINENGGKFSGQKKEEARANIVSELTELGLLVKIEPHKNRVGLSYRSKAVIEPYISEQWFVNMSNFSTTMADVVKNKDVVLTPPQWNNTYFHWINNLRDWCISRQLVWGHRIPVWYNKKDPTNMICYDGEGEPEEVKNDPQSWYQDSDVLDTWFSSALWPFATMDWHEDSSVFKKFYPTSILVTGHDIIFFWVARMIMMGKYAIGEVPFARTFLHGLIYGRSYRKELPDGTSVYVTGQDKKDYDMGKPVPKGISVKWEKLSKSKGNVIDPLEMIDEYGTDALRMALCFCANQSPQIDLDRRKFEDNKHFANKVWNGSRFVFMNLKDITIQDLEKPLNFDLLSIEDRWILSVLNNTNKNMSIYLDNLSFDKAAFLAYDFFHNMFCSKYLEISKPKLQQDNKAIRIEKQKLLVVVLSNALRLLHPMAPFITEELFQILKKQFDGLKAVETSCPYINDFNKALNSVGCIVAPYPSCLKEEDIRSDLEQEFSDIDEISRIIRNIRAEMTISPKITMEVIFKTSGDIKTSVIEVISSVTNSEIAINKDLENKEHLYATGVFGEIKISVKIPEDLIEKEKERLQKDKLRIEDNISKISSLLDNPAFIEKADPSRVEQQKALLKKSLSELNNIKIQIEKFNI